MTIETATTQETTAAPAPETQANEPADVGEEMTAFATAIAEEKDPDAKAEPEPKAEQEAKADDAAEDSEDKDEAKADEGEPEEDGEKDAKTDEEPKKKRVSTHQRQKAKIDHLRNEVSQATVQLEETRRELEHLKADAESREQALQQENQQLRAYLEQVGYEETPESRQVNELQRELEQLKLERAREAEARKRQQELQQQTAVNQKSQQMRQEVEAAAASAGIDPRQLGAAWVERCRVAKHIGQPEPTVADVAQEIALIAQRTQQAAAGAQYQHSSQAPVAVAGRGGGIPDFAADVDGMTNFLKANGLV